jgi:hypothetical protein
MKLPFSGRSAALVAGIVVISLVVGGAASYLIFQKGAQVQRFAPLIKHPDLSKRPMESFTQSQSVVLPPNNSPLLNSTCPALSPTWVADENMKPGVQMSEAKWKALDLSAAEGSALWLDQTSASCGAQVSIHAALYTSNSTPLNEAPRTFAAWRIGYYGGAGAREVWRSTPIKLKKGKAKTSRSSTRYVEANWPTVTTFTVGSDWTPGLYLLISYSSPGHIENAAPLVVRSPIGSSKLLMMNSFISWQMYNSFGGRSGYFGPGIDGIPEPNERSRVVSFDRPMLGSASFSIQRDAIPIIQFYEKHGINVDHETDLDINKWPSILTKYSGIILGGHAEYFTNRMFNSFIAARNTGINIAIFGGNTAFWQTRLEPSKVGADRRIVMYRFATDDPNQNLSQVTIEFANKRLNTPPSLISGEQTSGVHVYGTLKPVSIPLWLHITKSTPISGLTTDSEVESVIHNAAEPPNVHIIYSGILAWRDTISHARFKKPIGQVDWFAYPSGGALFNAGLSTWSCQLSDACVDLPFDKSAQELIRSITLQVLKLWQTPKVGSSLK